MNSPRTTLYRDKQNAKLMGVCSGIADYTGVNVFWVRLGVLGLTFMSEFAVENGAIWAIHKINGNWRLARWRGRALRREAVERLRCDAFRQSKSRVRRGP